MPRSAEMRRDAGPLRLGFAVYGVWMVALLWLALKTANPPQLNLLQISRATLIVSARVDDLPMGRCRVQSTFSPGPVMEDILVTNLSETWAQPGQAYLLPLVRDLRGPDGSYRVVAVAERDIPPLIYPAGAAIESQLESWQRSSR